MIAFITVGGLGVFGAKPFGAGEETRAKDAKDAKVEGMEDDEIAGVVGEWGFALDMGLGRGRESRKGRKGRKGLWHGG